MKSAGFLNVFTKEQMGDGELPPTPLGRMYANSYSPYGGAWVMGVPMPFAYTRVKIDCQSRERLQLRSARAAGVLSVRPFKPGVYRDQVEPIDLAPTLAVMLGINKPTSSSGRVLTEAIAQRTRSDEPAPQRRRSRASRKESHP